MAATTAAVVGTALAVKGQVDQRKAAKNAAKGQERAAIQSAEILGDATRAGEQDIIDQTTLAAQSFGTGVNEATNRIQPFVEPGVNAFNQATSNILQGGGISGPLANSIRNASTSAVTGRPELFNLDGPVAAEVERLGGVAASGEADAFNQRLLEQGQQGIAAASDVSGIKQRGLRGLADLARGSSAQRASVLVGANPQLANLANQGQEAKLLTSLAKRQGNANIAGSLARLAGRTLGDG